MRVKTNIRAGSGGADNTQPADTSGQNGKGGVNSGGGGGGKVVYVPPVSRCVGL